LRYAWGIIRGRHLDYGDVTCLTAQSLEVSSKLPVPIQIDGDACGCTPAKVEIAEETLVILRPPLQTKF
jgi:diacylglycerol kinase family enzyme